MTPTQTISPPPRAAPTDGSYSTRARGGGTLPRETNMRKTATAAAMREAVRLGYNLRDVLDLDPESNSYGSMFIGDRGGIRTAAQVRAAAAGGVCAPDRSDD